MSGVKINAVFTRLSDHLQPVACTIYLNDIPLCHENCARVGRPSLPGAGVAIHPALGPGKGVVWFTRLDITQLLSSATELHSFQLVELCTCEFDCLWLQPRPCSAWHPVLPEANGWVRLHPYTNLYIQILVKSSRRALIHSLHKLNITSLIYIRHHTAKNLVLPGNYNIITWITITLWPLANHLAQWSASANKLTRVLW